MRTMLVSILFLLSKATAAFALPGVDISVGPYVGMYGPSFKTLNDERLAWEACPKSGSAATFGGELKVGLPMGVGFGVDAGLWSKEVSGSTTPNINQTWTNVYKVRLIPVDLFAAYSLPLVPMVLKANVGITAGMTWARMERAVTHVNNGTVTSAYWNSDGSGSTFGLRAGLDLVSIPRVTVGADAGYRFGKVSSLTIKESSIPGDINTVEEYTVHATGQDLPLPLELNGFGVRLVARYHF